VIKSATIEEVSWKEPSRGELKKPGFGRRRTHQTPAKFGSALAHARMDLMFSRNALFLHVMRWTQGLSSRAIEFWLGGGDVKHVRSDGGGGQGRDLGSHILIEVLRGMRCAE